MTGGLVRLSPRVRFRAVADEGVLVQLESQRVLVVSEVGLHVVRLLGSGSKTLEELAESVASEFEVEADQARADIEAFVGQLGAERAIVIEAPEAGGA